MIGNREKPKIRNAVIVDTFLGIEDHGIMTCWITLDYGGGSRQGFGGFILDTFDKLQDRRVGTSFGMSFIMRILEMVGVTRWEDLKGKHVRAKVTYEKIHAIGHIVEDKWFEPDKEKL